MSERDYELDMEAELAGCGIRLEAVVNAKKYRAALVALREARSEIAELRSRLEMAQESD